MTVDVLEKSGGGRSTCVQRGVLVLSRAGYFWWPVTLTEDRFGNPLKLFSVKSLVTLYYTWRKFFFWIWSKTHQLLSWILILRMMSTIPINHESFNRCWFNNTFNSVFVQLPVFVLFVALEIILCSVPDICLSDSYILDSRQSFDRTITTLTT